MVNAIAGEEEKSTPKETSAFKPTQSVAPAAHKKVTVKVIIYIAVVITILTIIGLCVYGMFCTEGSDEEFETKKDDFQ